MIEQLKKSLEKEVTNIADYLGCNQGELLSEVSKLFTTHTISILEAEKKRLEESKKWEKYGSLSPFGHAEYKGYNECLQDQISYLDQQIKEIKEL